MRALAVLIAARRGDAADLVAEAGHRLADPTLADETPVEVAAAVVVHDVELADEALRRIVAPGRAVAAMAEVAAAASAAGRHDLVAGYADRARRITAEERFKRGVRDVVLCSVAHLVALAGDLPAAEAYLRHIEEAGRCVQAHLALAEVASAAGESGCCENFLQRAMSVVLRQTPDERHELLRTVIEATVRLRRRPDTARLLDLVTDPRGRVSLMVDLAAVLPEATTALLANALREGHLDLSIAAVAARDPRVWIALAEEAGKVGGSRA